MLDVVVQWDLPNKQAIAAAAAAAAMAAAGLDPAGTDAVVRSSAAASQPTIHTQQAAGTDGSSNSSNSRTSKQQQQQARSPGPVAHTAADAVLLLHRLCGTGYRPPGVLVQHLLSFVGPRLHELSLLQVGGLVKG